MTKWPWIVLLRIIKRCTSANCKGENAGRDVFEEQCGGTLVSNSHVITAAHCIDAQPNHSEVYKVEMFFGIDNRDYTELFRTGTCFSESLIPEYRVVYREASTVHKHPQYKGVYASTISYQHDIAIIEMKEPIKTELSSTVRPICLPGGERPPPGENCFIAGWGFLKIPGLSGQE